MKKHVDEKNAPDVPAVSKVYAAAKKATLKQVRELKVGDIIKAFYIDSEEPQYRMIVSQWCASNKEGQHHGAESIPIGSFGMRSAHWSGPGSLNTDKWVRVAHGGDLVDMLTRHATQQGTLNENDIY